MLSSIYLRLSVTDRCNLRCRYCRPEAGEPCVGGDLLSCADFLAIVQALHAVVPVRKVRVTGGEPLLRDDVIEIVASLRALLPHATLGLTTNGTLLQGKAQALRQAGLNALNLSLDAADPQAFAQVTRGGRLQEVRAGLIAASRAGFDQLKVNAVLLATYNGGHLADIVRLALDHGAEPRFIELMPSGEARSIHAREYLSAPAARALLARTFRDEGSDGPSGTAERWRFRDGDRVFTVGFINPVSTPFCDRCDRLRLDSRGTLWGCLRQGEKADLAAPLRSNDLLDLTRRIQEAMAGKRVPDGTWAGQRMVAIGG